MSLSLLLAGVFAALWCLVRGEISPGQLLLGAAFGFLWSLLTGAGRGRTVRLRELPRRGLSLCLFFLTLLYQMVRSNLDFARRLLRRQPAVRPGVVRVPLGSDSEIVAALEAHAITIAPGQMVVDYGEDGRTIYVHVLDVEVAHGRGPSTWRRYRTLLGRVFS